MFLLFDATSYQDVIVEVVHGTLYIPEGNKPGVDFVMPPWIFQSTIAKNHDVKKLEKTSNYRNVIPSCICKTFRFPNLVPDGAGKFILLFDAESLAYVCIVIFIRECVLCHYGLINGSCWGNKPKANSTIFLKPANSCKCMAVQN